MTNIPHYFLNEWNSNLRIENKRSVIGISSDLKFLLLVLLKTYCKNMNMINILIEVKIIFPVSELSWNSPLVTPGALCWEASSGKSNGYCLRRHPDSNWELQFRNVVIERVCQLLKRQLTDHLPTTTILSWSKFFYWDIWLFLKKIFLVGNNVEN